MNLRKVIAQLDKRIAWIAYKLVDFEDTDSPSYHFFVAEKTALEIAKEIVKQEDEKRNIERMEYGCE